MRVQGDVGPREGNPGPPQHSVPRPLLQGLPHLGGRHEDAALLELPHRLPPAVSHPPVRLSGLGSSQPRLCVYARLLRVASDGDFWLLQRPCVRLCL